MPAHSDRVNTARMFKRRTIVLGAIKLALLGSLARRMYYLQVTESPQYRLLSDDNRISLGCCRRREAKSSTASAHVS